LREFFLVFE